MPDPTGINFNGPVYAYRPDQFSDDGAFIVGNQKFLLRAGEEPGIINLSSPDTPNLLDGPNSTMTGSGSVTNSSGETTTFEAGSIIETNRVLDFAEGTFSSPLPPDTPIFWMAEIIQDGEVLFVSNYNFQPSEVHTGLTSDATPGDPNDPENSIFEEFGIRIDDIAAPDAPSEEPGGSNTYVAWNGDDVSFVGGDVIFSAEAITGTFTSRDNDDWIGDGTSDFDDSINSPQYGDASVGGTNSFTNEIYQAELAFWIRPANGPDFKLIQVITETGDTIYLTTGDVEPGESFTVVGKDGTPNDDNPGNGSEDEITIQYSELNTNVCLTRGTLVTTLLGDIPVENLSQGDMVLTADRGYMPIRWIGSQRVESDTLHRNEKLRPIRICAGALGHGLPMTDLLVSRQHRILVNSKIALRMFGESEVLLPAKELLVLDGIYIDFDVELVEYYHFLFDQHEIVFSNGAATESLFTGPVALNSISTAAKEEILTLFPELNSINYEASPARLLVNGRKGKKLINRHKKNCLPLTQDGALLHKSVFERGSPYPASDNRAFTRSSTLAMSSAEGVECLPGRERAMLITASNRAKGDVYSFPV